MPQTHRTVELHAFETLALPNSIADLYNLEIGDRKTRDVLYALAHHGRALSVGPEWAALASSLSSRDYGVDDVAAAVLATLGNEEAAGRAFNLADCYARWADWAQMTAELLGVEADIDFSSPSQPNNVFAKDAAQSLGISLDRGHEGIRRHLHDLIG